MKTLKPIILLIIICLTGFLSCKSRKVAITSFDSTITLGSETYSGGSVHFLGFNNNLTTKSAADSSSTHSADSSVVVTTVTPAPGTQITVDANGTFYGQAQSVQTTRTSKKQKDEQSSSSLQETAAEIKLIDSAADEIARNSTQQTADVKKTTKNVDAKADDSYVWVIIVVAALIIAGLLIWWKMSTKTVSTAVNVANKIIK